MNWTPKYVDFTEARGVWRASVDGTKSNLGIIAPGKLRYFQVVFAACSTMKNYDYDFTYFANLFIEAPVILLKTKPFNVNVGSSLKMYVSFTSNELSYSSQS